MAGSRFQDKLTSLASVKYGTAGGRKVLAANRTVANMVEQSPAFLVAFWTSAVLVGPAQATQLGVREPFY